MLNWNYKKISDQYLPRQFEYHPSNNNILFGCVTGECLIVNPDNNQIKSLGNFGRMENDVILGLCWLRNRTDLFICGSGDGNVTLNTSDAYDSFNARDSSTIGKANPSIIRTFERFKELTSVHVNCSDEWILLSGYTPKCDVLDLETGSLIRSFENIHRDHINISRFTHTSPSVFATCSFDETVKLWDMRVHQKTGGGVQKSIYSVKCDKGIVMMSFSPNDSFFLTAGIDNEIKQYYTLHGGLHKAYDVPKLNCSNNFTRAYYCNVNTKNTNCSGDNIVTGSSEDNKLRFLSCTTGETVVETELYPDRLNDSLYVQSVRSHPEIHNEATVLVNYKEGRNRELIRVKFNESGLSDRVFSTFRSSYGNSDTYSVPSGLTTELTALTSVDMESSYMDSGCDVAADVEVSMSGMNCMEDLELFEFDKPLATYPSNLLYSDMNQLCNTSIALCKSITHTKNTDVIASDVSGSVALNSNELNHLCLDDGDMLSLVCSEDESEVQDGREENIERVVHSYPVHLFILQHRCPTLWKYWEGLECENSKSGSCNRALCINKAVVLHLLSNRNSDEKSKNFNHDCNNDVKSMHKVFNEFQHVDQYSVAIRIFVQYLYTGVLCQVPFKRHLNHNGSPTSSSRLSRKAQCILILWDVLFLGTHTNLPDLCSLVDIALSRMMDISTCFFIAKIASVGERIALYNLCKGYILHRYDYLYYNYTRCALSYPVLDTEFCENLLADIGEVMHVANNRYCTKLIFSLEDLVNNYSASVGAPPICNGHSITVMNHFMYVIGGRSDDSCYSIRKIPVYNMLTKHWSHIETTICVSDMDCSQLDKDTIDATDNSSQSQESSTPVNQFFHSASPLCHESSCNLGGRYIITLAGMVHTSTKQSDQNVFILDTFAMKWIRPLVSSEIPNSSQTNHVNSNTPANNDIPPVMCGAMVCISNLTTSARVTQLLTFGGYIAADRTITNDVHLVTVTEHPCYTSNSSGNGNGNKEGLPSGCDHSSDFSVSCQRLVNRAAGGNQFRIRSPAPVMNHSACLCYPFNGGDYVSDAISMATCAAYPTRMLIYGGISFHAIVGNLSVARLERDDGGSGVHIVWEVCELVDDSPVPDSRYGHSMTTLPHNGLMVMYGGRNDDQSELINEMWELRLVNITANGALQFKWSRVDLIYNPLYLGTGAGSNNPSQVQACLQDTSKTPEEPPHCLIGGRINHVSVAHEGSLIIYGGSYKELHQMRHGGGESTFYSSIHRRVCMLKLDEGQKWWDASDAIDSGQWFYNDSKILMKHAAKSRLDAVIENEASASANENSSSEVETVPTNIVCSYNGVTNGLLDSCHISFDRLDDTVPSEGYVKLIFLEDASIPSSHLFSVNMPKPLASLRSTMIQAVLASDMQEAHSCTVTLECPTVTVGLSLVLYLVAGLVAVKPDDIFDLLGVANRYSMPTLVSYIEYTLVRQLNMENLCTLLMYAAEYSMNVLQECCTCMALKHYEKFVEMAGPYNSEDAPDNSGECREGDDFPTTTVPKEVLENIHNMRRNKMVLFNETIPTHSANSEH